MKWEHQLRRELEEMGYSPYRHASNPEFFEIKSRFIADMVRFFGSQTYQMERKRYDLSVEEANCLDAQEDDQNEGLGGRAVRR